MYFTSVAIGETIQHQGSLRLKIVGTEEVGECSKERREGERTLETLVTRDEQGLCKIIITCMKS